MNKSQKFTLYSIQLPPFDHHQHHQDLRSRPQPMPLLHRESDTLFTAGSEAAAVNGCRRFMSLVRLHKSGLAHAPKPEMVAAAYDVATIALKGHDTPLNFSNDLINYPILASLAAGDIRVAAARAAANRAEGNVRQGGGESSSGAGNVMSSDDGGGGGYYEYMEEEALLNMPKMLADMAEGMLVSPPRGPASNDSPENSDGEFMELLMIIS